MIVYFKSPREFKGLELNYDAFYSEILFIDMMFTAILYPIKRTLNAMTSDPKRSPCCKMKND